MSTGAVPTQLCSHPSHAAWWGTSPELPVTDFYHRSSKCKKCYIRQQQESKTRRITPGSTPTTPGSMGEPRPPLSPPIPMSLDTPLTASGGIAKSPYPNAPTPGSAPRLGPAPVAAPRPMPNAASLGFNMSPGIGNTLGPARTFTPGMPTFSTPSAAFPSPLSHHPHHSHHTSLPHSHSASSFSPSLPLGNVPAQPYYTPQPQPQAAATTPFILSRPPREVNRKVLSATILKRLKPILDTIRTSENAWPFNQPVDPVALELDDYNEIIKKPMDLKTIDDGLANGKYATETQLMEDVRLVWENAKTYNKVDSEIYDFAIELSEIFETNFKRIVKECEMQAKTEAEKEVRSDICAFCGFGVVIPPHQRPQPPPSTPSLPLPPSLSSSLPSTPSLPLQKVQTQTQQITFQPSPSPSLAASSPFPQLPPQLTQPIPTPVSTAPVPPPPLPIPLSLTTPLPPSALTPATTSTTAPLPVQPIAPPSVASPPLSDGTASTPAEPKTEETSSSPPLAPTSPPLTPASLSQPPTSPPLTPQTSLPSSPPLRPPPPAMPTTPLTPKPLPLPLPQSLTSSLPQPPLTSSQSLSSLPQPPLSSPFKPAAPVATPLLHCDGACLRAFHPHCLNLTEYSTPWLCNECRTAKPVLHWDPAKSEYFYYYYDTNDAPPAPVEEEEYVENRSLGSLPRETKRKLREEEEDYRARGDMYFDDMWCMWRCRSREVVQQRDERQKHVLKKMANNAPER